MKLGTEDTYLFSSTNVFPVCLEICSHATSPAMSPAQNPSISQAGTFMGSTNKSFYSSPEKAHAGQSNLSQTLCLICPTNSPMYCKQHLSWPDHMLWGLE